MTTSGITLQVPHTFLRDRISRQHGAHLAAVGQGAPVLLVFLLPVLALKAHTNPASLCEFQGLSLGPFTCKASILASKLFPQLCFSLLCSLQSLSLTRKYVCVCVNLLVFYRLHCIVLCIQLQDLKGYSNTHVHVPLYKTLHYLHIICKVLLCTLSHLYIM